MNEFIDLTQFEGWTVFLHISKALVAYNTSRALLKNNYSSVFSFIVTFFAFMAYSWLTVAISNHLPTEVLEFVELLMVFICIILLFTINYFLYNGKLSVKIVSAVIGVISYPSIAAVFKIIIVSFIPEWIDYLFAYKVPAYFIVTCSTFAFFASFVIVIILKLINAKTNKNLSYKTKYCWFYFFPVTHFITNVFFQVLTKHITEPEFSNMLHTAISSVYIVLLIIDFALIFFIDHFEKIEIKNVQYEVTKTKNELDFSQIELLKEEKQNFRKIKHDYLNFLTIAQGLIEIDQKEKALELLKDTTNELLSISSIPLCSNETINTALFIKQNQASQLGIKIDTTIEENHIFKASDYDISRILFNLLDNAIEAVSEIDDEATQRIVNLYIKSDEEKLFINCENPCLNKKTYRSPERGNGIKIIKDIVKRYKGDFSFEVTEKTDIKIAKTQISL